MRLRVSSSAIAIATARCSALTSLAKRRTVVAGCFGAGLLAGTAGAASFSMYPTPTPLSLPGEITVGPDGNLWFTEQEGNRIGRITPAGAITEFLIPTPGARPYGITAGPDGNLWFAERSGSKIGRITTAGAITEFPLPAAMPLAITAGPDGNLWFTDYEAPTIRRMTTAGTVTEFALPTPTFPAYGITTGPDGNLWFAESSARQIGRITTAGVVTEFPLPAGSGTPADVAVGPDGNLWFTEFLGDRIGRITPQGVVTQFQVPGFSGLLVSIAAGLDGNLWFTNRSSGAIGRVTPGGVIAEFRPSSTGAPQAIVTGPDGNLWFTDFTGQIGRLIKPMKGDLNGDGTPDLVLHNASFISNGAWFMDGVTALGAAVITPDPAGPEWSIRGVDDFDGDDRNDLVFWNSSTGAVEFWILGGASGVQRVGPPVQLSGAPALPTDWNLAGTGDFNGDNLPDLIWRNRTTQKLVIWVMDGTAKLGDITPVPDQAVNSNWSLVATLDYNGDGWRDLLWYNESSGKIVTWYMDGSVARVSGQFATPSQAGNLNWKVVAGGEFSKNYVAGSPLGASDIVWRNETTGKLVVWHMDHTSTRVLGQFTSPAAPASALEWTVVGPR